MSNESERNPCHCPVCVAVPELAHAAGCVPLGAEAAARTAETLAEYCARYSEILAARRTCAELVAESERLRTFLKDCRCPCCDARARLVALRDISYERACASPAAVHCTSTDRRDDIEDAVNARLVAIDKACLDEFAARNAADAAAAERECRKDADAEETVHSTGPYHETDTDAR